MNEIIKKYIFYGLGLLGFGFLSFSMFSVYNKLKCLGESLPKWLDDWISELKTLLKQNNFDVNLEIAAHYYNLERAMAAFLKFYKDDEVDNYIRTFLAFDKLDYFLEYFSDFNNHLSEEDKKAKEMLADRLGIEIEDESYALLSKENEEDSIKNLIKNVRVDQNVKQLNVLMVKKYIIRQGQIYNHIYNNLNDHETLFKFIKSAYLLVDEIEQYFGISEKKFIMNLYLHNNKLLEDKEIYDARVKFFKVKLIACKNNAK